MAECQFVYNTVKSSDSPFKVVVVLGVCVFTCVCVCVCAHMNWQLLDSQPRSWRAPAAWEGP